MHAQSVTPANARKLAEAAARNLAECEYPGEGDAYPRLSQLANETDLQGRISIAAAIYAIGDAALLGSRALDNCFENNDGRDVVHGLVSRAQADPFLYANIAHSFGGTFPQRWLDTAAAVTESYRQRIALRLASPMRADPGRTRAAQADAGHLPLFIAANEPVLL